MASSVIRRIFVLLHRYIGLVITLFLITVGLTGCLLAFQPELNRLVTPHLFPAERGGRPLDLATLAERAGRELPIAPDVVGLRARLDRDEQIKLSGPAPLILLRGQAPRKPAGKSDLKDARSSPEEDPCVSPGPDPETNRP